MSNSKKELPLDDVNQIVLPFVKKGEIFRVESCEITSVGGKAVGFQGEYYVITVVINVGKDRREFEYFLKSLPSDDERAEKLKNAGYHKREIDVYMKIFSEFDKVQKSTEYRAKCFLVTDSTIILENLFQNGYKITNSRETFDREHCMVALSSLAKLHAGSLIFEDRKTKETGREFRVVNEFAHIATECGYKFDDTWLIAGMEAALAIAGESIQHGKDSKIYKIVESKWGDVFKKALKLCGPSKVTRNVVCHRDLWANNLMFSYTGEKPNNCVIIDYQAVRCLPPMGDVVGLLFLNLTSEQREYLFDDMIKYYYEKLKEELGFHKIDIDNIYLWNDFKNLCDTYKLWGIVQTIILHQLALLKCEDVAHVLGEEYDSLLNTSRKEFVLEVMKKDVVYRARMLDNVDDLIRLFILKEQINDNS